MKYIDKVYGELEINEPVILEIINSPTMQRLKDIDQAGNPAPFYPCIPYTRFEHSVGVYLLLRKYGAPLEEQIAGLIHDASHSAFSHCVDYALEGSSQGKQDHQDNIFDEYIKKSEIPAILKKYDLDLDYILNDINFPLKENNLPDICADRIDYSLRTAISFYEIDNADYFLDNLTATNGQWVFKDFTDAKKYAELFRKLNHDYYSGFYAAIMLQTVGDYLKYSLQKDYISHTDLYTTDKIVLEKIAPHLKKDEHLQILFDRMNNKIKAKNDPQDFDRQVFCKSRIIDPLCFAEGQIKRVSDIEPSWLDVIKKESKVTEYFLKFDK